MNMKSILASAAALGLVMGTAACGGETEEPVAEGAPDAPAGITVTDGWMALPAVAGNPAAVYFNIENSGERNRMIRSAYVEGAGSAVLHQMGEWNLEPSMDELMQLDLPAGESIAFEPESYHVMAMDVADTLQAGGETEVTLTFVGGDKVSFPVEIRAAGDAPGGDASDSDTE
ncbi:copper chaperone PCu(A)C [Aurantiacibacter zhengii]|uniref:Copper chaperone PCu(A)C n=1 Tax=Aurantiacibacter zhengii TaxID=2307003 RepID=A0A418NWB0_9SPHN|nr:copper chaperone PCu(A)C [Aurantiacibacter zhengii]RIV88855.1 copper chaperone PCu(A)C [Aurantiacibacter zhengii]